MLFFFFRREKQKQLENVSDQKIDGKVSKSGHEMARYLSMWIHIISNFRDPTELQEAVSKKYVDSFFHRKRQDGNFE